MDEGASLEPTALAAELDDAGALNAAVKRRLAEVAAASPALVRDRAPHFLRLAQAAWRAGRYDADWESAVERLAAHARSDLPWALTDLALMAALRSPDRIAGSPWLGPLAPLLTAAQREGGGWAAVLAGVLAGDGGAKPAAKFPAQAARALAPIGADAFWRRLMGWLEQHPLDPNFPDPDADALKQLIWLAGACGEDAAPALGRLAQRCFVKVAHVGARSVKLGNAALAALGLIAPPAAGAAELDRLRQRVKYPSAQKQIEAALARAAGRAGLTVEDLAELAVPDFDLGPDACARIDTPDGGATLSLTDGRRVSLLWHDAAGQPLAAPPAALKRADPSRVKQILERRRALDATLAGQIARIEGLFGRDRSWSVADWSRRYAGHALLGPLSRRLIWRIEHADGRASAVLPTPAGLRDADGREVAALAGDRVRLWHPILASVDEVLAWRAAIVARGIVQPFKQAHREIYRLTDAERAAGGCSNRFAGHILRQHQLLELAKARGWTGTLQGGFDGDNDPTRVFADAGLRVSYAVRPIVERADDLGPTGIALRVTSGRVRFAALPPAVSLAGVPPVSLADVPPVVLSEALRDVDLFVAVASLGADPDWRDGGPHGRFADYWRGFARAELEESGRMRHAILAAVLPRLAIAGQCALEATDLVVRGRRGRYRIHLGSGAVFVEPDGQYLCLVAEHRGGAADVALPFEGDAMLAAILSKAMLLARDDQITDPSILRQFVP